jgi:hypothetical protein
MAEKRLGIVNAGMANGYWDLHVTPARIIAAQLASEHCLSAITWTGMSRPFWPNALPSR